MVMDPSDEDVHTQEESVACENGSFCAIFCIVANASFCMTVCPECLNGHVADLELLLVLDHVVDLGNPSVCAKDGESRLFGDQLHISAGVIPVVVCTENRGEFCAEVLEYMHELLGLDRVDDCSLGSLFIEDDVRVIVYEAKRDGIKDGASEDGTRKE